MNGITNYSRLMKRLLKWPVMCGLLSLALAQTLPAAQDYYINNSVVASAPNIDATNFINNGSFTSTSFTRYETTRTRNYTNNGSMTGYGGFQFDTFISGSRTVASSFYNPGSISVFSGSLVTVSATNIVNPGVVDVGFNGGIFLTGQNLDLTYGTLNLQGSGLNGAAYGIFGSPGANGVNTNRNWDPGLALTPTNATSSGPLAYMVTLFNSKAYVDKAGPMSNLVVRAVFIQDDNGLTNNVYFDTASVVPGSGNVTIEWQGTSSDPASGLVTTNYVYLNNNYALGASTNVVLINGIPSNFTFTEGGKNLLLTNAALPMFQPFPPGAITNPYSYTAAQFYPTTAATGPTSDNPSGAVTNLPGRTQISASRDLNLSLATITGQNYLSLTSTNQFDGNDGALIVSPISDINLGVTNGFLVISNLLQSVIPVWTGTVQAWSTRWFFTDTNGAYTGVTNGTVDFRVMIVRSSIFLGASPQVQDLTLHSTNLFISDQLNVTRNLSIDARSLTLTTNGAGAGSIQGELNLESDALFSTSLPNLRWLTNNGAISTLNSAQPAFFGSAPPNNYFTLVNRGSIYNSGGTVVWANDFQNSGIIYCGPSASFTLQSLTANIQGSVIAEGDVSITSGSLVVSNLSLPSEKSLTLTVTNLLTDGGPPAGNIWSVSGAVGVGIKLLIKPATGDLLGTFISVFTPANVNKVVVNTWAGQNRGTSASGYSNNVAVGQLTVSPGKAYPFAQLTFTGTGISNAIYVDQLILAGSATSGWGVSNIPSLAISSNMVIYYAQALSNGVSVAQKINHWNTNRLRWVPSYAGYYSSTNVVSGGTTNLVNLALRQSPDIDSDGDGIFNLLDPTPVNFAGFPTQVNLTLTVTNLPPQSARLKWVVSPNATSPLISSVYYTTNLSVQSWMPLSTIYSNPSTSTNVLLDVLNPLVPHYYRVAVEPWLTHPYSP